MEVSGSRQADKDWQRPSLLCDPCRRENEDETGVFYCTVCNEYLCDGCGKAHRKAKPSKGHELLDGVNMPQQKLTLYEEGICSKHSGKQVEYHCTMHGICCCSVCVALEHKQCTVEYIDDKSIGFEKAKEYKSLAKHISYLTQMLQKTKDISTNRKEAIQSIHARFVSDVKNFRVEINSILDSLESFTLIEAERMLELNSKTAESVTVACDSLLSEIEEMSSNLKTLSTFKQKRQLVISCKMAAARLKIYNNEVDSLSKQNVVRRYNFQPDKNISHFLQSLNSLGQTKEVEMEEEHATMINQVNDDEKLDSASNACNENIQSESSLSLKSIGQTKNGEGIDESKPMTSQGIGAQNLISTADQPDNVGSVYSECVIDQSFFSLNMSGQMQSDDENNQKTGQALCAEKLMPAPSQSGTASYVGSINIQHSTDTGICWITGGVMIDYDKLALVDRNNSSVKVLGVSNNTVIACGKLPTKPWSITCVTQDQLVVTCDDSQMLFIKVGKTLSITKALNIGGEVDPLFKQLDLGGNYSSIAYTNNTFIVTFAYPESSVKIINMSGKVLKTFKTIRPEKAKFLALFNYAKSTDGKDMFHEPWFIALSKDQRTIFVADVGYHSIMSLDFNGTVQHVYNNANLGIPSGLAVDMNDNVYIAGNVSNNLFQLSPDGKLIQVKLDKAHGLERPQVVAYCKTAHRLYISHIGGTSIQNELTVLQLPCKMIPAFT